MRRSSLIVFLVVMSMSFSSCTKSSSYTTLDASQYDKIVSEIPNSYTCMPSLDDLGAYTNIQINRRPVENVLFDTMDSINVIVTYSNENYLEMVESIDEKYVFLDQATEDICDVEVIINGVEIKVVEYSNMHNQYCVKPYYMMLVGFDDSNNRIIYFYHWDIEVAKIEDLNSFIRNSYYMAGI